MRKKRNGGKAIGHPTMSMGGHNTKRMEQLQFVTRPPSGWHSRSHIANKPKHKENQKLIVAS